MKKPWHIDIENFKSFDATKKMSKKSCLLDFVVNINQPADETQQPWGYKAINIFLTYPSDQINEFVAYRFDVMTLWIHVMCFHV